MSSLLTLVSAASPNRANGGEGSSAYSFLSGEDITPTCCLCSAVLS